MNVILSTSECSLSAAGFIRLQWDGTLTGNGVTLRAPDSLASKHARSTAAASPAITTCPGKLKFAAETPSSCAALAQTSITVSSSRPEMAAMAPVPRGTASCIYLPLSATSPTASVKLMTPAQTRAEYSPRLCPAIYIGRAPPFSCQIRQAA